MYDCAIQGAEHASHVAKRPAEGLPPIMMMMRLLPQDMHTLVSRKNIILLVKQNMELHKHDLISIIHDAHVRVPASFLSVVALHTSHWPFVSGSSTTSLESRMEHVLVGDIIRRESRRRRE